MEYGCFGCCGQLGHEHEHVQRLVVPRDPDVEIEAVVQTDESCAAGMDEAPEVAGDSVGAGTERFVVAKISSDAREATSRLRPATSLAAAVSSRSLSPSPSRRNSAPLSTAAAARAQHAAVAGAAGSPPLGQTTKWIYKPANGKPIDVRDGPAIRAARVGKRINLGQVVDVSEVLAGAQDVKFLRLADGSGWVFQSKPDVGVMFEPVDDSAVVPDRKRQRPPCTIQ